MTEIRDCRDLEFFPSVVRDFKKVYEHDKARVRNALQAIDRAFSNAHEANDSAPHYEWLKEKQIYGNINGLEPEKIQSYAIGCLAIAVDEVEFAIDRLIELKLSL